MAYPHRRDPVLRGLDLELAPGRPVALTGPSGSGKTSVVLALLRFIDLSAGRLTVDGADARMLPPEQIRELIAWSPEQPALFPAPLRANLRVGAPHTTDRQITELLGQLGLGPWLDQLESGLETVVAPWGHPVSGGELQRLSVARALLANRPVLLLDEPTGHLDPDTAATVLNAVLELTADRSLLWITHRPEELRQFPEVRGSTRWIRLMPSTRPFQDKVAMRLSRCGIRIWKTGWPDRLPIVSSEKPGAVLGTVGLLGRDHLHRLLGVHQPGLHVPGPPFVIGPAYLSGMTRFLSGLSGE